MNSKREWPSLITSFGSSLANEALIRLGQYEPEELRGRTPDAIFPPEDIPYLMHQSLNYITSHNGFTLYDLVSYDRKNNWMNGQNNQDGMDDNCSWNCGDEGDEAVPPAVLALRRKQVKNFCCMLLLSNGLPMMRAGHEFLNTQFGDNNPYNQHNEIVWLDWSHPQKSDAGIYVMINGYWEELAFHVQDGTPRAWNRIVDKVCPWSRRIT
jgi:hypothetical protein